MTPRSSVPLLGIDIVIGFYLEERERQRVSREAREELARKLGMPLTRDVREIQSKNYQNYWD